MLSSEVINTIGLGFDMIGAILVAYEVVNKFKGDAYVKGMMQNGGHHGHKTKKYEGWQRKKLSGMRCGLYFLISGFLLQILATWIP